MVNGRRKSWWQSAATANGLFGVLVVCAALPAFGQATKKRVAVLSFGVSADARQNAASKAQLHNDLGEVVSDLLIQRLVQDQEFIMVERAAIDKIIKEQNFSNSDRVDANTAAKIGRIAGVDAIIVGTVTQFDLEKKGNKAASVLKSIHMNNAGLDQQKTTVTIATTVRMIDTSSAVVIKAVNGAGDASVTQTVSSAAGGLAYSSSGSDFRSSVVGQAVAKAVGALAESLETVRAPREVTASAGTTSTPVSAHGYSGIVADVDGKALILTVGTSAGVRVGDVVEISRAGRTIKNPQTNEVIKVITTPVGHAKVTEADAKSATATFTGDGAPQVNDLVKSSQ